jgi:transposase-like protein
MPELVRQGFQALIKAKAGAALGPTVISAPINGAGTTRAAVGDQLATPTGDIPLRIPSFHADSLFPTLLKPRRRMDRAGDAPEQTGPGL